MPPVLKTLSTITVWILFIVGLIFVLSHPISHAIFKVPCPVCAPAIGVASLILSVVAAKLRQTME